MGGPWMRPRKSLKKAYRKANNGTMIYAGKYIVFAHNYPLNTPDRSKFFGGGFAGYTDYPGHDIRKGAQLATGGPVRPGECV